MIAACPKCKTRFKLDESKVPSAGVKLRCSKCFTIFAVKRKEAAGEVKQPPAAKARRALIAHSDPSVCDMMEGVLKAGGIEVLKAYDGVEALGGIEKYRPQVAILDVSLPKMYGFEVCEHVKGHHELKEIKVILMASVYDKTRYKRNPVSIYGADDYIEKHHIHDDLLPKINKLTLSKGYEEAKGKEPGKATVEAVTHEVRPAPVAEKDVEKLKSGENTIDDKDREAKEKARRLARIIVSDIALYNGELVAEGVRNETFYKLMKDDIKEGLEHFKKRVPSSISAEAYLKEAFEDFISKRKKEMGL